MLGSNGGTLPVSIPIGVGNGNGFGNNNFFDDILALAIVGMIYGNGNGFGMFGGNRGGVNDAYILNTDMAAIESKIDSVNNGICSLGYDQLAQMNGIDKNILQGVNTLAAQLADCCCKTQQNIKDTQYNIATTGAGIQNAIKDCCCENERIAMQNRYESAQNQCATLQAIDKLGDRIIGYMADKDYEAVKSENQMLKNQAFMQQLVRPTIQPCYVTQNPYCSCGNATPYPYGYYGTTVA